MTRRPVSPMKNKRSQSRQVAMQILFQSSLVETDLTEALAYFRSEHEVERKVLDFARELIEGTLLHQEELDACVTPFLEKWDLDRLGNVERAILRLAAFEFLYRPEIPAKVSINEAVELAKEFSTDESAKFVNGVLDRLARERAADKMSAPKGG
ncbi:MAG: transcription antitermination factor NusB [Candidatus Riflebacteria bacterium]|nr:transcription antitermination factor NusB [Candidatus Riflebacteria bacterium]